MFPRPQSVYPACEPSNHFFMHNSTSLTLLLLSATLAASALLSSCGDTNATSKTLRFTAIPDENSTELIAKFNPVAAYLSDQLGVAVEYVPVDSYSASVEAFKNGDVQLAWFGGLTGAQARAAVDGARAIAQGVVDPNYKSYFIAHKDSGLEPGDDFPIGLADVSFTFGSESSTSGRLMPEYFIRQNTDKAPSEFFGKENSFSGAHDKTAELVQAGTFQAGALSYKTYDKLVDKGTIDASVARIIWTTPTYPDYNFTAHPSLDENFGEGFTDKLQKTLIGMKDVDLLNAMTRPEGLITATNEDFQSIHDLATELGFIR
ncbi:MAG: phosphonate transport system substrate-binding protein [Planctomycetota bacterium]|jgi:phosphonate transport system substrate-binding protein